MQLLLAARDIITKPATDRHTSQSDVDVSSMVSVVCTVR